MSAFAAIVRLDGGPAEARALSAMAAALAHRGPDGCDRVERGPAALAHLHFWTVPEEVGERQPLIDKEGRRCLVFDGRLDNRDEIRAALGTVAGPSPPTDAALVLAALGRWGEESLPRLLGPFALLLVDLRDGSALAARDPLGGRTLFYSRRGATLLAASEEGAVLAHPEVSDRVDETSVCRFFAVDVPAPGATFFSEVCELPPGHLLAAREGRIGTRRFWAPDPAARVELAGDEEYGEHFRELLAASVRCRLRGAGPPAVMMSGGLDSTSIAALAALELRSAGAPHPVRAVSWVFDELTVCDERTFIEPVVESLGLAPVRVTGDDAWPLRVSGAAGADPWTPEDNPFRELKRRAYVAAAAGGSRVVLNGGSADLLYSGTHTWLVDLLRDGRWREAGSDLARLARRLGPARALRGTGILGALRPGLAAQPPRRAAPWLTDWARRVVSESPCFPPAPPGSRRPAQHRVLLDGREARGLTREIFHASRAGIELRHPYRDRRLIEFALAVPTRQLYRQGRHKPMVRTAMHGILPLPVLHRDRPTSLLPLYSRGVRRLEQERVRRLLGHPAAIWPRYVRRRWLERTLEGGGSRPVDDVVLWHCLGFESWRRRADPGERR